MARKQSPEHDWEAEVVSLMNEKAGLEAEVQHLRHQYPCVALERLRALTYNADERPHYDGDGNWDGYCVDRSDVRAILDGKEGSDGN